MMFLQIEGGEVVSVFSSPQDENVWPGLVEVEDDDARYLEFVKEKPAQESMSPVEKLKAFLTDNPDVAELIK